MKNLKKISLLGIILAVFTSCDIDNMRTVIDEKLPDFKPVLVFNNILATDTTFHATLSTNQHILTEEYRSNTSSSINNAKIRFYENDAFMGFYQYKNQHIAHKGSSQPSGYYLPFKPKAGKTYKIKAEKEGFSPIEASFTMPKADAGFRITEAKPSLKLNGQERIKLTYVIEDKAGKDFYELKLYRKYQGTTAGSFYLSEVSYQSSISTGNSNGIFDEDNDNKSELFSDELFSEKKFEQQIFFDKPEFFNSSSKPNQTNEIEMLLELRILSEGYFKYARSIELARSSDNPLAQPVQVFSNVKNGLGIFGGYTYKRKSFVIKTVNK